MGRLEVWAPHARAVTAELSSGAVRLEVARGGWHRAEVQLEHGDRYAFRLDGGPPLPAPRSAWQPEGVHAASAWVDHGRFEWTDAAWAPGELRDQVFYELHTGTFSPAGTFAGVEAHLDHLLGLGVTAIELMPVAEFAGNRGWGYDGVDLFAPHHAYGGPEALKHLVDTCHARGLAVVLDVVYNHAGAEGNYLARFGPYFSDRHGTAWGSAFNFDGPEAGEVRRFVVDNAIGWLRDYHLDGLRLDAVHAIVDESGTHVVEEVAAAVRALAAATGRQRWVIAESDLNDPRIVREIEAGGQGLDAQWCDDFHHAVHACLTGERDGYYADFGSLADVAKAVRQGYVLDGRHSVHRNRPHGRSPKDIPPERFVVCVQNHDQVGNRARGERLCHLVSPGLARCAAAVALLSPYVPLLFAGEEWAASTPFQFFSDHLDPAIARATTEGRVREFQAFGWDPADVPDPEDPATCERSRLDWGEVGSSGHAAMLEWYRTLLALRRERRSLRGGGFGGLGVTWSEEHRTLVFDRGEVVLACNLGDAARVVALPPNRLLAASAAGVEGPPEQLAIPPETCVIVEKT